MDSRGSTPDDHGPCPGDDRYGHPHELIGRLRTALDGLGGLADVLTAMAAPCCDGRGAPGRPAPGSGAAPAGGPGDGGEAGAVFAEMRESARFELLEVRPALPEGCASGTSAHHRLIVSASAAASPGAAERLSAVTGRGALVRTAGLLPLHIAVADRESLAVALDLGHGPTVLHTARTPGTARNVAFRFLEDWWPRARPCGPAPRIPQGALTGTEAAVIEGLAQGLTDESVARRVGVTPRTVRRHVAAVSERYGATSRLQLGLLLGRVPERAPVPDGRGEPGGAAGGPSPVGAAAPHPAQGWGSGST